MGKHLVHISRFLSLVLRHAPDKIGLSLDSQGWAPVEELLEKSIAAGTEIDLRLLKQVVETNDKQRFSFSEDGLYIRANQGHSQDIDLGLKPVPPPAVLYHGTATRFISSIKQSGLRAGSRRHVHLSPDEQTAIQVGSRHGVPSVLRVNARQMATDSHIFYLSENGVWLTGNVPPGYINFPAP